jgi:thiosulfate/3-mercaptopyruvate sulfurtransferase
MGDAFGPLVDPAWLVASLGAADLRVIDATWYAPIDDKDARAEFTAGHIPGAVYIDISDVCDPGHSAPHMLPPAELFADFIGAAGIDGDCRIVVYDNGEYAATRLWWMFRVFGHDRVALLDGGLAGWSAAGGGLETATPAPAPSPAPAVFKAVFRPGLIRSMADVLANIGRDAGDREQMVDARPPARFAGELPEMRPGLLSGHIPGSVNLHYADLIDDHSGRFRAAAEIEQAFRDRGIDLDRPVVATCGSGVSACHLALGLFLTGRSDVPVYDGSWAEWGAHPDNPRRMGRDEDAGS